MSEASRFEFDHSRSINSQTADIQDFVSDLMDSANVPSELHGAVEATTVQKVRNVFNLRELTRYDSIENGSDYVDLSKELIMPHAYAAELLSIENTGVPSPGTVRQRADAYVNEGVRLVHGYLKHGGKSISQGDHPGSIQSINDSLSSHGAGLIQTGIVLDTRYVNGALTREAVLPLANAYGLPPRHMSRFSRFGLNRLSAVDDRINTALSAFEMKADINANDLWRSLRTAVVETATLMNMFRHLAVADCIGTMAMLQSTLGGVKLKGAVIQTRAGFQSAAKAYAATGMYDTTSLDALEAKHAKIIDGAADSPYQAIRDMGATSVVVHDVISNRLNHFNKSFSRVHEIADELQLKPTPIEISAKSAIPVLDVISEAIDKIDNNILVTHDEDNQKALELRHNFETALNALSDFRQPFISSGRAIRKSGLSELTHDLIIGYEPKDYVPINGISSPDAERKHAHVLGLESLTADSQVPSELLKEILDHEATLVAQALTTYRLLGKNKPSVDTDMTACIADTVSWLSDNRDTFKHLLRNKLDTAIAERYIKLLDRLLPPNVDVSKDPIKLEAVSEIPVQADPDEISDDIDSTIIKVGNEKNEHTAIEQDYAAKNIFELPISEGDVAYQLDWEVFPAEVSINDIERIITKAYPSRAQTENIDWTRIKDLMQLASAYEGNLYRSKPNALGRGKNIPYFVAEIEIEGRQYAVAENPAEGNASYVLRADLAYSGAAWQEVFAESRLFARMLGAERVIHRDTSNHLDKIMTKIQELHLVRPTV